MFGRRKEKEKEKEKEGESTPSDDKKSKVVFFEMCISLLLTFLVIRALSRDTPTSFRLCRKRKSPSSFSLLFPLCLGLTLASFSSHIETYISPIGFKAYSDDVINGAMAEYLQSLDGKSEAEKLQSLNSGTFLHISLIHTTNRATEHTCLPLSFPHHIVRTAFHRTVTVRRLCVKHFLFEAVQNAGWV